MTIHSAVPNSQNDFQTDPKLVTAENTTGRVRRHTGVPVYEELYRPARPYSYTVAAGCGGGAGACDRCWGAGVDQSRLHDPQPRPRVSISAAGRPNPGPNCNKPNRQGCGRSTNVAPPARGSPFFCDDADR